MAKQVRVILEDDLDGDLAQETVSFGLDGHIYEIDLNEVNAANIRQTLAPFISVARKSTGTGRRPRRPSATPYSRDNKTAKIREWALTNGIEVSDRGRINTETVAKYDAAQGE